MAKKRRRKARSWMRKMGSWVGGTSQRARWLVLGATLLLALELITLSPWGCSINPDSSNQVVLEDRLIRVRLLAGQSQVTLSAGAPPTYFTLSDSTERQLNIPGGIAAITLTPAGWRIGNGTLGAGELIVRPRVIGSVAVNGRPYRGQYRFVPVDGTRFDVVNDVDIDDYLKGVIADELLKDWHIEAYKAQAVAARTYALYEKHAPRQPRHWDVYADTRSQVYGGLKSETPRSVQGVDDTARLVLACEQGGGDHIFKAYFSACCGGVGQSAGDGFAEPPLEPLSEKYVGGQCAASRNYNWGPVLIRKDEVMRRLRQWAAARARREQNIDAIRTVEISARNRYGRPTRFAFTDARGVRYELLAEHFRNAMNTGAAGTLPSSYVENIINESDQIRIVGGHGSGHGVGLCQWCAQMQAAGGMGYEDILRRAYPGSKLLPAY